MPLEKVTENGGLRSFLEDIRSTKDNTLRIESAEINEVIESGLRFPDSTPFTLWLLN